jgi:hypothetical protein
MGIAAGAEWIYCRLDVPDSATTMFQWNLSRTSLRHPCTPHAHLMHTLCEAARDMKRANALFE